MSYEEEEEDTCVYVNRKGVYVQYMSYEEEDTCMSHEEDDTCYVQYTFCNVQVHTNKPKKKACILTFYYRSKNCI